MANLYRMDPTRTITLRKNFQSSMGKRFLLLLRKIRELVVEQDAFGLNTPVRNEKFASTQVNLNDLEVVQGIKRIQKSLDKADVIEIEKQPHVTVRYGLHGEDASPVKRIVEGSGPVYMRLGKLSLFRNEKQDVLKIEVFSNRLNEMNRLIGILPNTQTYQEYNPHLTIAYLKPRTGDKYLKLVTGLEDKTILMKGMVFSNKAREHTPIVLNTRWQFSTDLQKFQSFTTWLQLTMRQMITSDEAWWLAYLEDAYRRGAKRATDDVMRSMPDFDEKTYQTKDMKRQIFQASFGRVVPLEKIKILGARVFSDLSGITAYMEAGITRALVDGLAQGQHPKEIASNMAKTVGIGLNRARTLSQTEIIRAHAEGQLDGLEKLGVDRVGITVEWSTAGDNHVCKLCQPLEGIVLTLREARGLIPRHPRCRCSFKPAGLIDRTGSQIKTKRGIDAAIDKSLGLERKPTKRSMAKKNGNLSAWVGAKLKVTRNRPKSIMD